MQHRNGKIGVIDLGTNTFNLLIAEKNQRDSFKKLTSHRIPVLLGEKTIASNTISAPAFERGINAMREFAEILKKHDVHNIKALATSALRTSINALDFTNKVHQDTGIKIEVISGDKEAELIFAGNRAAAGLADKYSLIMDIGGGSTEFIIGNSDGIYWKKSYLLGAARLLAKFNPEDPVSKDTINRIENYFESELQSLIEILRTAKVIELIGSSGAFDSFAEMIDAEFKSLNFTEKQPVYCYDLNQYNQLADRVINSTLSQRLLMRGLIPMRAEMIVISFIFTNYILRKTGVDTFRSTTWSLKEGAVLEWINTQPL